MYSPSLGRYPFVDGVWVLPSDLQAEVAVILPISVGVEKYRFPFEALRYPVSQVRRAAKQTIEGKVEAALV